jgi:hypothetical protein
MAIARIIPAFEAETIPLVKAHLKEHLLKAKT